MPHFMSTEPLGVKPEPEIVKVVPAEPLVGLNVMATGDELKVKVTGCKLVSFSICQLLTVKLAVCVAPIDTFA